LKMVLDSRFIMEYFYSDKTETKQKATKKLKDLIQRKEGILPTIVISETIQTICEKIGKEEAEICYANLTQSGLKIQSLTSPIAKQAGLLRSKYRNIPMGDCIIAATAIANQATILSDDPHFDAIQETKSSWI
jgi:predicted nucleic acid-binding protein